MMNKIWAFFIVSSILFSLCTGNLDTMNKQILDTGKVAFEMTVKIIPVMALWLGIMKIASLSGLLSKMACKISRPLKILFSDIPKNHESFSLISSNIIANLFGLGNAATPFGLKAMESLQTINPKKDTASRSMITFLVLNTSGLTLIPTTIISLRMMYGSKNPTEIVVGCILATLCATLAGLLMDRFLARRSRHD